MDVFFDIGVCHRNSIKCIQIFEIKNVILGFFDREFHANDSNREILSIILSRIYWQYSKVFISLPLPVSLSLGGVTSLRSKKLFYVEIAVPIAMARHWTTSRFSDERMLT